MPSARRAPSGTAPKRTRRRRPPPRVETSTAVSWFEVPVEDVDRAVAFYESVLGCSFTVDERTGDTCPMFTAPDGAVLGALNLEGADPVGEAETVVSSEPGEGGPSVHFTVDRDLSAVLDAVESAGGEVRVGAQPTPAGASYAVVLDTEGNRVGLMTGR